MKQWIGKRVRLVREPSWPLSTNAPTPHQGDEGICFAVNDDFRKTLRIYWEREDGFVSFPPAWVEEVLADEQASRNEQAAHGASAGVDCAPGGRGSGD